MALYSITKLLAFLTIFIPLATIYSVKVDCLNARFIIRGTLIISDMKLLSLLIYDHLGTVVASQTLHTVIAMAC